MNYQKQLKYQEDLLHRRFHREACIQCVECCSMKHEKLYLYSIKNEPLEYIPKNKRLWHTSTCIYDENRYKLLFEAFILKSVYDEIIHNYIGEYMLEKLWKK